MSSEPAPDRVRAGDRLLVLVEDVIYVSIAALLAASALVVLVRAAIIGWHSARSDADDSMIEVLDALLLVFIFVELLYAVRTTLTERQIVAEPFLIAGILTAIKEIIVLSVKAANEYLGKGPEFARAVTEIGVLGDPGRRAGAVGGAAAAQGEGAGGELQRRAERRGEGLTGLLEDGARHHHALHLVGALVDLGDLGVAHHPLDREVRV